jgi:hypothetical protein
VRVDLHVRQDPVAAQPDFRQWLSMSSMFTPTSFAPVLGSNPEMDE